MFRQQSLKNYFVATLFNIVDLIVLLCYTHAMMSKIQQIDPIKLTEARKSAGLSQADAAALLHLKPTTLANYESGFARPQPHVLAAMCSAYNIDNPLKFYSEVENLNEFSPRKKLQSSY